MTRLQLRRIVCALALWVLGLGHPWAGELVLQPGEDRYPVAQAIEILEDPALTLTPAEAARSPEFRALPSPYYSPGYSRSAWWARLRVYNRNHPDNDWLLVYKARTVDRLEAFVLDDSGAWHSASHYRENLGDGPRDSFGYPVFRLRLPPGMQTTVLLRMENTSPITFVLDWTRPYTFFARERIERLMVGVAMAVPFVVAVQVLLLWVAMRDPAHLLLAGLQLSLLMSSLWLLNYLPEWLPNLSPRWQALLGITGFNLAFVCGLLHVRRFLRLPEWQPFLARALLVLLPWCLLGIVLELLRVQAARPLALTGAFIIVTVGVSLSWLAAARRLPYAVLYAWGWSMLLPSLLTAAAARLHWLPPQAWGMTHIVSSALAALVFAFAVSAQVAHRERERREAVMKTDIFTATHHDLQQPLHSLGIFLQLLEVQPLNEKTRELLRRMQVAHHSLNDFLDSLLHLARHGRSALAPVPDTFAIHALLGELAVEYREQARQYGLQLRYVPSHAWVRSDRRLLERIVRNLLVNALRYTPTGRILLGCRRHGDDLSIEVWDTGPGIPEEKLQRLFEPLVHGAEAPQSRLGFGLGLAVVHQLANVLGHRLHVRSRAGRGTCFMLLVPMCHQAT